MKSRKIDVSKYDQLDVKPSNFVYGEVQGKQWSILLDSGSPPNVLLYAKAERLGVLTGYEQKEYRLVDVWLSVEEVELIYV